MRKEGERRREEERWRQGHQFEGRFACIGGGKNKGEERALSDIQGRYLRGNPHLRGERDRGDGRGREREREGKVGRAFTLVAL